MSLDAARRSACATTSSVISLETIEHMAKKPDGGYEVLLGDRQLLSLFVIVVVLLAVFFTMGYVLGRHTGAASTEDTASKEPAVQMPPRTAPSTSPAPSSQPVSTPVESVPEPAAAVSAPATAPVGSPPVPPPEARTKPPAREPAPVAASSTPAAGQTFLLVVARTGRPDAEVVAGVLKKKGFPALVAPSSKQGVFRVLVGPLADKSAINATLKNLNKAGFPDAIVQRY
jgi:cell division protein FtsN